MMVEEAVGGAKVKGLGVIDGDDLIDGDDVIDDDDVIDGDVVGGDDFAVDDADVVVVGYDFFDLVGYDYSVFSDVQEEQEVSLDYAAVDYGDDDDGDDVTVSDH